MYPPLPSPSANSTADAKESKQAHVDLPACWDYLPFLALPDGVHHNDQDYM